ncbi:MAG: glycosyltransferase family 4 protein [Patescibacteria group bacterium]
MRILIVNHEFPPLGGGASNASWFLARSLKKMGHEITVITASFKGELPYERRDGLHIYRVPALRRHIDRSNILEMSTFAFFGIVYSRKIIRERRIERIIAFFTIPGGIVSYYINKLYKIPFIVSLRGGDVPGLVPELDSLHRLLSPIRRSILNASSSVIANSAVLKNLSEKYDPINVSVIPNGVDTDFFRPTSEGKVDKTFHPIFVGRLHMQKNLVFMLDAISDFKKSVKSKFMLEIVGDGPQKQELKKYARKIGIKNEVTWTDWLKKDELLSKYNNSDCLIMPSLYEGMSNVILEALACGLPVVASDISANRVLVKHGINGFLFKVNRKKELQEALELLVIDKKKRVKIGRYARGFVVSKFSWDLVAKRYSKLL